MSTPSLEHFQQIFLANMRTKSNTVRTQEVHRAHDDKPTYRLAGEALRLELDQRVLEVAADVYMSMRSNWNPHMIAQRVERWHRSMTEELYAEQHDEIAYRTWPLEYNPQATPSDDIKGDLAFFYNFLSDRSFTMEHYRIPTSLPGHLAWIDREFDRVIHPFADGCGRIATSLVMWFSLAHGGGILPRFTSREEHYASIDSIDAHTNYYARILRQA